MEQNLFTNDDIYDLQEISCIYEASEYRPQILRDMEDVLSEMKKTPKSKKLRIQLSKLISKFTNIDTVILSIKPKWFNASVLPVYKKSLPKEFLSALKEVVGKEHKRKISASRISVVNKVEESAKNISHIYVIIGDELISHCTPQQMVAVILHELGHVFARTSNWPNFLPILAKKLLMFGSGVTFLLRLISNIPPVVLYITMFITIMGVHGLTFLDRIGEYRADNFAAKYGYGDELVKLIYSIDARRKNNDKKRSFFIRIISMIYKFFETTFDPPEHPSDESRINNLKKRIEKEFKELYPEMDNELTAIFAEMNPK